MNNIMGRVLDSFKSFYTKPSSRVTIEKLTPQEKEELDKLNRMTNIGKIEESMRERYGATVDTKKAREMAKARGKKGSKDLGEKIMQ